MRCLSQTLSQVLRHCPGLKYSCVEPDHSKLTNRMLLGGVTSFCFGRQDETRREMFVCAQQRLWRLRFGCRGKSILPIERAGWFEWTERTAMVTAMDQ